MSQIVSSTPSRRRRLTALLRRPWLVAGCLALACFASSAAISALNWPLPNVHDEFSYLLAADTFAHGRLTNPTHPQWQHFETFHVIQQPTYASKYPPGQGAVLALGERLAGQPIVGAWLLSAIAAAATYWMMLGWTSSRFAALGGLLWAAQPGFQIGWGQSYWGGTLAYLGGALVFGAALRMQRRARALDACTMGAGSVILAVSRPFEGCVFCLLTGVWLVWHWARTRPPSLSEFLLKLALPQAIVLSLGGLALGAYDRAVTGSPFTFPYSIHERTYGQAPLFIGQSPKPKPEYRHAALDDFHTGWEMDWYRLQSTWRGWLNTKISVTWIAAEFLLTPVMAGCVLLARPWRWRRLTPIVMIAGLTYAATLAATWNLPHYIAPVVPLLLIIIVAGVRRIDVLGRRSWARVRLGSALVALQVGLFAVAAIQHVRAPAAGFALARHQIADQLRATPGRDLVVVRYGPRHSPHQEWVYNDADIDGADIVWARSMDRASNADLLRYFSDRHVWLLEPDARSLRRVSPKDALAAASQCDRGRETVPPAAGKPPHAAVLDR